MLDKKRITGRGHNRLKTHPKLYNEYGYYSQHAEVVAVMKARGEGDTLVVVRIAKNGSLTCSMPCRKCMEFMKDHGIKTVFYSDWNGEIKEMRL